MAYAEAIAHGLPVVGTSAGAIPDTVPRGAGSLSRPTIRPRSHRRFGASLRIRMSGCGWAAPRARPPAASRPGKSPRRFFRARLRPWNERIFCCLAGATRTIRRTRAQRGCLLRRCRVVQTARFIADRRPRLWHRFGSSSTGPAACRTTELAACRQRSRSACRCGEHAYTPEDVTVSAVALDLTRDLEAALEGPIDLVTASALLDLVSKTWLERLAVEKSRVQSRSMRR